MKKSIIAIIGFSLFIMGTLSLVLSLVGMQFSYMKFLDFSGRGLGFLLRILMIVIGLMMIYLCFSPTLKESDYE